MAKRLRPFLRKRRGKSKVFYPSDYKTIVSSGVVPPPPIPIQAQYQTYLNKLATDGVTAPPSDVQTLQNRWVYDVQSIWSKIRVARLFATNYNTTSAASLYNLKNPSANLATTSGTITYSYGGWKGDGVNGYIANNFNPTSAGAGQNSAYEAVFVNKAASSSTNILTGCVTSTTCTMRNALTLAQRLNSGGDLPSSVDLSGTGYKALNRPDASNLTSYADLVRTDRTRTSFTLPNEDKLILRQGSAYGDAEISAYFYCDDLTEAEHTILRNATNDYITGIYLLNYSNSTPINVYIISGQSNATGRGVNSSIAADLTGKVGAQVYKLLPTPPSVIDGTSNWQELELGVNNTTESLGTQHGFEMRFGKNMYAVNPNTWIIKFGIGGTSMATTWNTGGSGYSTLVNNILIKNGLNYLRETTRRPIIIRGFIWMQGESDCVSGLGAAYQASQLAMVKGLIDNLNNVGYKTNKLRIWDFLIKNGGSAGYTTQDFNDVNNGKIANSTGFFSTYPTYQNTKLISWTYYDTASIPLLDTQHFSTSGLDTMGTLLADYFSNFINE